jgi:hypothetical protein
MRGSALAYLAIGLATAATAHAERPGEGAPEQWLELAIPDFRYEFAIDAFTDGALVASFPLPFVLDPWRLGYFERTDDRDGDYVRCNGHRWYALPAIVLEPQWRIGANELRLAAAARAVWLRTNRGPHVLTEAVGVGGTDGLGGGFGIGVGFGGRASLTYRALWTTDGQRNDVVLDVHLFGVPMGKYARSVYEATDSIRCEEHRRPIGTPPRPDPLDVDPLELDPR